MLNFPDFRFNLNLSLNLNLDPGFSLIHDLPSYSFL